MPKAIAYTRENKLAPFSVTEVKNPYNLSFSRVDFLSSPAGKCVYAENSYLAYRDGEKYIRYKGNAPVSWESAYCRTESEGNNCFVELLKKEYSDVIGANAVLESMAAEHLIARNHGFIFHCSYIEYNEKAILFTAPSGTGKSTQAELWHQYRGADIINGDRAAVRLAEGVLMAESIPFSGSSQYCKNRSIPIQAIVYLGQAPKTSIRTMRGYEAFFRIWEGVSVNTWDKTDVEIVTNVVQTASEQIPVFHLMCTPDESAVNALEDALRKQERV